MRLSVAGLPLVALLILPAAASAQVAIEGRVDRLEQEMRAVQRKVFPGGAGAVLQPEVTAPPPAVAPAGSPAGSQVADLTARVNALETQVSALTGQMEQNSYKLRQLEQAFEQYKAQMAAAAAPPPALPVDPAPAAAPAAQPAPRPAPRPTQPAPAAGRPAAAPANEARKTAVAAIERPDTGNAAEDAYTYGFRLWTAKFYPEAQAQLQVTVERYGSGPVGSRAQNLLGRAYLDDGKYALASVAFYENYQKRPQGERAADSLAYLGDALIALRKLPDACKVYQELEDVYGATLRADLRAMVEKGKVRARCSA